MATTIGSSVPTSSVIGVNLTRTDTTAQYAVGTVVNLSNGGQAMYVKASTSALSTYGAVSITKAGLATLLTTTNAATTSTVGFAQVSVPTSSYAWVHISGKVLVNGAAQCAPALPLFTTATAGVVDDATVSAGYIPGITAATTISNATALTCMAQYPHIARYGGGA